MKRTHKTYVHNVGDFSFTSQESQAIAKQNAAEHVTKAYTDGDWRPAVLTHKSETVIVTRNLDGWTYAPLGSAFPDGHANTLNTSCDIFPTRRAALDAAGYHVAQGAWERADGTDAPAFIADEKRRADFAAWATFQTRFQNLRAAGFGERDAYSFATDDPANPCPEVIKQMRDAA